MRLPILPFLLLPVIELWLMIEIGSEVSALAVIVWLVAMIFIGINLLRYLGASSMLRTAQTMRSGGELPAQSLADNLFKAVGAVLLIIPGFLTDLCALFCFIPLVRRLLLKRWLTKMAANSQAFSSFGGGFTRSSGNVYEHQGATRVKPEPERNGILIDQQPESTSPAERKND